MFPTCQQMQQIEAAAFANGVSANELMEAAGLGIARVIMQQHPQPGLAVMYLGKGNNAGDALVAARELSRQGWMLAARFSSELDEMKPLPLQHWRSLRDRVERWSNADPVYAFEGPVILLDGLLGIGSQGALHGTIRELAAEMNEVRRLRHATTITMDIPSGLDGDTGVPCENAVVADLTITVAHVKLGLLADAATAHVGRLALVPLAELDIVEDVVSAEVITSTLLRPLLPRRWFDMHKGQAGRVALIAGSRGFLGAAVLAALGALRGGAGLITLLAKPEDYDLLAMKMPPEVMVKPVDDYRSALTGYDAIAIGPGLGFTHEDEVCEIVTDATLPVVVDADALTIVGKRHLMGERGPRLFTPHPGEMARLVTKAPDVLQHSRAEQAFTYVDAFPNRTLLLKGSRTIVATKGQPMRFNTTGTPAMAAGGMGDVLSGLCAALLAQGMHMHDAASAGSWLLGRAAELAVIRAACSLESLSATDVAAHLGAAFDDLKHGVA